MSFPPSAAITQCISLLGLLNQRTTNLKNILLSLFLKLDVYSLGIISRAIFPLKELEEGLFKPHLQLLVLCWQSDLLCLVEISSWSLPSSSHNLLLVCVCVCVCIHLFQVSYFYKDSSHTRLVAQTIAVWLYLNNIYSDPISPIKWHSGKESACQYRR